MQPCVASYHATVNGSLEVNRQRQANSSRNFRCPGARSSSKRTKYCILEIARLAEVTKGWRILTGLASVPIRSNRKQDYSREILNLACTGRNDARHWTTRWAEEGQGVFERRKFPIKKLGNYQTLFWRTSFYQIDLLTLLCSSFFIFLSFFIFFSFFFFFFNEPQVSNLITDPGATVISKQFNKLALKTLSRTIGIKGSVLPSFWSSMAKTFDDATKTMAEQKIVLLPREKRGMRKRRKDPRQPLCENSLSNFVDFLKSRKRRAEGSVHNWRGCPFRHPSTLPGKLTSRTFFQPRFCHVVRYALTYPHSSCFRCLLSSNRSPSIITIASSSMIDRFASKRVS